MHLESVTTEQLGGKIGLFTKHGYTGAALVSAFVRNCAEYAGRGRNEQAATVAVLLAWVKP